MSIQTQITQTIAGKDEPNIVYMHKPQQTSQQGTQIIVYFLHIFVCCTFLVYDFSLPFRYCQPFCKVCHLYILVNIEIKPKILIYLDKIYVIYWLKQHVFSPITTYLLQPRSEDILTHDMSLHHYRSVLLKSYLESIIELHYKSSRG